MICCVLLCFQFLPFLHPEEKPLRFIALILKIKISGVLKNYNREIKSNMSIFKSQKVSFLYLRQGFLGQQFCLWLSTGKLMGCLLNKYNFPGKNLSSKRKSNVRSIDFENSGTIISKFKVLQSSDFTMNESKMVQFLQPNLDRSQTLMNNLLWFETHIQLFHSWAICIVSCSKIKIKTELVNFSLCLARISR